MATKPRIVFAALKTSNLAMNNWSYECGIVWRHHKLLYVWNYKHGNMAKVRNLYRKC